MAKEKGKSDFDRFVADNLDKATMTIPKPGDDGVPSTPEPPAHPAGANPPMTLTLPDNLTPQQKELIASIMDGRSPVVGALPVAEKVEEVPPAVWNPYQQFYDRPREALPSVHVTGDPLPPVVPKEGANPVLVESYELLRTLVAGGWILPGLRLTEAELLIKKLKTEVEG